MSVGNALQFAITREDPEIEIRIIEKFGPKRMLAVCSAGDTLLAVQKKFPGMAITGFDFNPLQLKHFQSKAHRLSEINSEPNGLCQNGNFESLFRQWRLFLNEFIINRRDTLRLFQEPHNPELITQMLKSKYWEVNFNLHFHDSLLLAMFGEAAVQHAPQGSYPRYFQNAFERGFEIKEWQKNPFLQHLFLGEFLEVPDYLKSPASIENIRLVQGTLFDVLDYADHDFIQLSNITDWSSTNEIQSTCDLLKNVKTGTILLFRQINNRSPITPYLGNEFRIHEDLATKLLQEDRSLFYSNLIIAEKRNLYA